MPSLDIPTLPSRNLVVIDAKDAETLEEATAQLLRDMGIQLPSLEGMQNTTDQTQPWYTDVKSWKHFFDRDPGTNTRDL
ncbi:hypothetical protein IFM51744_02337 [Aspergillus udagawae]|uniref:Uncharacterized protein n=1 Tax=Aspergillus udagawae TaxID=91492 RepID=A0ABQ1AXS8_9EURO|nr:hypothetical protein IFM51744_02337 [Aspergillus udagawae]GFF88514.1 hypothetical protein IFM53868_05524 [Aspergillus udagawae]GFG07251.1 hypothetical protein IFM5058_03327 [Aspergillus udagawae]